MALENRELASLCGKKWKGYPIMSDSFDPRKELASTYMVQDRSSAEEMARLQVQERLLTSSMGGMLAEQPEPGGLDGYLRLVVGLAAGLLRQRKHIRLSRSWWV